MSVTIGHCFMATDTSNLRDAVPRHRRRQELFAFLVLAVLIWPVIALGVVGGYGFIIWTFQIVFGPPGPPQPH
jgi:periplasmic nitrate reductase NapE